MLRKMTLRRYELARWLSSNVKYVWHQLMLVCPDCHEALIDEYNAEFFEFDENIEEIEYSQVLYSRHTDVKHTWSDRDDLRLVYEWMQVNLSLTEECLRSIKIQYDSFMWCFDAYHKLDCIENMEWYENIEERATWDTPYGRLRKAIGSTPVRHNHD